MAEGNTRRWHEEPILDGADRVRVLDDASEGAEQAVCPRLQDDSWAVGFLWNTRRRVSLPALERRMRHRLNGHRDMQQVRAIKARAV
jgi:hypothetical protein